MIGRTLESEQSALYAFSQFGKMSQLHGCPVVARGHKGFAKVFEGRDALGLQI